MPVSAARSSRLSSLPFQKIHGPGVRRLDRTPAVTIARDRFVFTLVSTAPKGSSSVETLASSCASTGQPSKFHVPNWTFICSVSNESEAIQDTIELNRRPAVVYDLPADFRPGV